MNTHSFGIDLGTSNIKIYNRLDDKIFVEKNMIAIMNKNRFLHTAIRLLRCTKKLPET